MQHAHKTNTQADLPTLIMEEKMSDPVSLVDPELAMLLDSPGLEISAETLPMARQYVTDMLQIPSKVSSSETVAVREVRLPGPEGAPDVRVLLYSPAAGANNSPAILQIHGGAYILGKPEQNDRQNRRLVETLGCVVAAVDYRLAPEVSGTASVEDCYVALRWIQDHARTLSVNPARIALLGDSAGGGLAAALALLARDRGEIALAYQMLIYPMLDHRTASTVDPAPHMGAHGWSRQGNRFAWGALLGHEPGIGGVSPYISPAEAKDLAGLPPTYICVGALDLFADEDLAYAQRLLAAGVPTELHVYPGAIHGFDLVEDAAVSRQFEHDRLAALKRALG